MLKFILDNVSPEILCVVSEMLGCTAGGFLSETEGTSCCLVFISLCVTDELSHFQGGISFFFSRIPTGPAADDSAAAIVKGYSPL